MGINKESHVVADLQIGPTDSGMVRIYVAGETIDLPMDFDPDDARDIAAELMAAADAAETVGGTSGQGRRPSRRDKPPR